MASDECGCGAVITPWNPPHHPGQDQLDKASRPSGNRTGIEVRATRITRSTATPCHRYFCAKRLGRRAPQQMLSSVRHCSRSGTPLDPRVSTGRERRTGVRCRDGCDTHRDYSGRCDRRIWRSGPTASAAGCCVVLRAQSAGGVGSCKACRKTILSREPSIFEAGRGAARSPASR